MKSVIAGTFTCSLLYYKSKLNAITRWYPLINIGGYSVNMISYVWWWIMGTGNEIVSIANVNTYIAS